jgi:hypothetical protein
MSPTPHGEAARIASDLLESADLIPWAHTFRCLLEEHGEMVGLLREAAAVAPHGVRLASAFRIKEFLSRFDGSPEPEDASDALDAGEERP